MTEEKQLNAEAEESAQKTGCGCGCTAEGLSETMQNLCGDEKGGFDCSAMFQQMCGSKAYDTKKKCC